ncbi:LacI family DNA-binding transcriptional regulator [Catellatospora bangladeshensis]|uniref:LacI family DNA-binding transcriptional regulator n=1 Tax=Catellatospora bangladeshensis TaxID=310355 RepID=UPI0036060A49
MLGGPVGNTTFDARLDGYRRAMEAFRVPVDPALVVHDDMSQDAGFRQTQRLLAAGADFTAIFAANDLAAAGAMRALRAAGKRVPDDVSIIGYDDTPMAPELFPALTSVHLPHEELGRTAVKLALQRGENSTRQHVMLGTHIAMRDSVRPLI